MRSIEEVTVYTWRVFDCVKCKCTNWFYNGASDDDGTGIDPEGVKCHKCGEIYHFLDEVLIKMKKMDNQDWENDLYIEEGEKKPTC